MHYTSLPKPANTHLQQLYTDQQKQAQLQQLLLIGSIGLQKAEEMGLLDDNVTSVDDLEKGRKAMPIGAKANWGGVEYLKTASGWKPVGKHRGNVKANHDFIHKNEEKDKDHHAMVHDAGKMSAEEWTAKHGSNLHGKYKEVHDYLHKPKAEKKPVEEPKKEEAKSKPTTEERVRDLTLDKLQRDMKDMGKDSFTDKEFEIHWNKTRITDDHKDFVKDELTKQGKIKEEVKPVAEEKKPEGDDEIKYTANEALKELASKSTFNQYMRMLRTGSVYGVSGDELAKELGFVAGDHSGNKKKTEDYYYKQGKDARAERKEAKKEVQQERTNQHVDNIMGLAKEQNDKMEAQINAEAKPAATKEADEQLDFSHLKSKTDKQLDKEKDLAHQQLVKLGQEHGMLSTDVDKYPEHVKRAYVQLNSRIVAIDDEISNRRNKPETKEGQANLSARAQSVLNTSLKQFNATPKEQQPKLIDAIKAQLAKHENGLKTIGMGLDEDMVAAAKEFLKKVA